MQPCTHTILIAEDDPDDQELIAVAFAQADPGLRLCIVPDGRQALDYLLAASASGLPCVILLDYNMPELNGAQVIRKLHEARFADIPKVILSTSGNPLYIEECLREGAHAYRVKPDDFTALVRIAEEMAALCRKAA
ncbi:response regulator [Flaviaesturariibacter amylovorans]|uniref:Response regulatory domain-containing protein n=1 Tax=Flaviaesturariibacter amylovorans TaxID=1084520 RepID=A0ABP8HSM6_9BACT